MSLHSNGGGCRIMCIRWYTAVNGKNISSLFNFYMTVLKNIVKWGIVLVVGGFVVLVLSRAVYFEVRDRTGKEVARIHVVRLTLDDVMGKNLPPDPGAAADTTIAGVDANVNGIRDDVELAIFKTYPTSAKTRAVLLQYALALQMEMTQKKINRETVTAVAEKTSAGYYCIGTITSRSDMKKFIEVGDKLHNFVESSQLNTEERKKAQKEFYEGNLGSYTLPSDCDLDLSTLPN